MADDRLTPGTFFVLLRQAVKQRTKARDTVSGVSDGLSEPAMLAALIRVSRPDFQTPASGNTFNQQASEFRTCKRTQATTYLPIGSEDFAQEFTNSMESSVGTLIERTRDFSDKFLDVEHKGFWLARALLTVLERDSSINDDQALVPVPGKSSLTKAELLASKDVYLDALVLGLWHHTVVNVLDNTVGRETFERWHTAPAIKHSQWKFNAAQFAIDESRELHIIGTPEARTDSEEEVIDAEIVDDASGDKAANDSEEKNESSAFAHPPTQQVVFNQYGDNSQQIASVETLNIGKGI